VPITTSLKMILHVRDIIAEGSYFGQRRSKTAVRYAGKKRSVTAADGGAPAAPSGFWGHTGIPGIIISAGVPQAAGVLTCEAAWARHNPGFTCDFEETAVWLTQHSTKSVIAGLMRIAWNTAGAIVKRVYEDRQRDRGSLYDGLNRRGIDETGCKKGHKYMTVI
jgi:hypothetical protein